MRRPAPTRASVLTGARVWQRARGNELVEIIAEPSPQRRRTRQTLSDKEKAAALFRIWHRAREMMAHAEVLDDGELVHFLAVIQLLIEERAAASTGVSVLDHASSTLPN